MDEHSEPETPEAQLLSRAKSGDLDAFEQIVMLHERRVFGLALRLTNSVEDAKDAMQETFIRMHRKLGQVDAGRSLGPWLYSVTVNVCRDIGRVRQRSRLIPMDEWASRAADPAANPEGLFSGRERERHLRAGLRTLPEKERAALLLREMEGLSTDEVARILGSSPATVRSQISTARVKLRKFFAKHLGEPA
jgi:RNA polymerase sigma-70 factor (ECF subfamily)